MKTTIYIIWAVLAVTLVFTAGYALDQRQQVNKLEDENKQATASIERLQRDLAEANQCHKFAENMAFLAEDLLVDLWDYGNDPTFQGDLQYFLNQADDYNDRCNTTLDNTLQVN